MRSRWFALILVLGLIPHALAAPVRPAAPLSGPGFFVGTLSEIDSEQKSLTLVFTAKQPKVNQEVYDRLAELQKEAEDAYANMDGIRLRGIIAEARMLSKTLYVMEEVKQNLDFVLADDVKVRLANPPPVVDAEGKPRKHTADELSKLKGPGNLPGYLAKLDDLKPNQTVRVQYMLKAVPPNPFAVDPQMPLKVANLIVVVEQPKPQD